MLKSGHFPSQLKISKVRPLFKKGDPSEFSNYRPISLLPSFSKIFEYVIFYQLIDYMCEKNLLTIEQFDFRRGHSTELAATHLVNCLTKQMDLEMFQQTYTLICLKRSIPWTTPLYLIS